MDAITLEDTQVVELRQNGKSFGSIARRLGYARPREAWLAFNRGLRGADAEQQAILRRAEMGRLEALTEAIKARADFSAEEQVRRLATVEKMRVRLLTV